jgi:hypothetical protein
VPATFLSAILRPLALAISLSPTLAAAPQEPPPDLTVSLDRIRRELERNPQTQLKLDRPLDGPVATFRTRIDQRVRSLTLEEWLKKEFDLNDMQRQSAEWASMCCGGVVLGFGDFGVRLDVLYNHLEKVLERRKVRKLREQIARELAELEAARKKAGLQ